MELASREAADSVNRWEKKISLCFENRPLESAGFGSASAEPFGKVPGNFPTGRLPVPCVGWLSGPAAGVAGGLAL